MTLAAAEALGPSKQAVMWLRLKTQLGGGGGLFTRVIWHSQVYIPHDNIHETNTWKAPLYSQTQCG